MPARQDQTLQIFLIVFIFLFLVSAVVAYLGWRGYSEADTRATALDAKNREASEKSQAQAAELEDLKGMAGFGRNDTAADVKKAAEADMKTYGSGVADEASRTYRKVLETVAAERDQTAQREAKLKQENSDLSKTLMTWKAETQKQIDTYKKDLEKAQAELASEQNSFKDYRTKLQTDEATLQKGLDDQQKKYEAQIAEKEATIKQLSDMVPKLEHQIQNLNAYRKDEPGSFEIADGRVTWVNQNGTLWINLGTADALRRQVTFSIFDADQHDAAKSVKKGSIEVTRLLGDHIAEARVTKDDPKNPILPGDNIYSQVWHRGKKLHFALTGVIDIDGDGRSDLKLARDLIELNGGIVDAYLGDDGKMQGDISANTRYLVLGELPDSPSKAALHKGYMEMSKAASSLGVQTMTLAEFLDQMGYKPQDRTVHLGAGATARDFPARADNGAATPTSQPNYRSRPAISSTAPATTTKTNNSATKP